MPSYNPRVYQAVAIASGLDFYAKTGMKVNRAYTPKNMMTMATKITGQTFKARAYTEAATALRTSRRCSRLSCAGIPPPTTASS